MLGPSRRTLVAVTLAVAALAGVTTAVTTRDTGDGVSALMPLDEPPATTPAPGANESPTASPLPEPAPTGSPTPSAAPAPTAEPAVTRAPEATATTTAPAAPAAPVGNYGPREPGSVTLPYRQGQTSWEATSNGIRFRITMSRAAKVGEPTTFTIATSSADSACCATLIRFGDGYSKPTSLPCATPAPSVSYTHTFNGSGRREFMVSAATRKCAGAQGSVFGTFDVAPGRVTAQGPEVPTARFSNSFPVKGHEDDPRYVSLYGEAADEDGYIKRFVVTFGDGKTRTFDGNAGPCRRSRDGWPLPSEGSLPWNPPAYHYYERPGTYTLTMTAYSTGCDGTEVQTVYKTFTWTVPAEETPSPTPSPSASR